MLTLAVWFGSLLLVAVVEWFWPRRRRSFPAARRRAGNLGVWLLGLMLAAFTFAPAASFRAELEAAFGIALPRWPIADPVLGFVVGFLLLDLMQYLVHRCQHAVRLLWRLHALHHSDPDLDVTSAVRHHPLEYVVAAAPFWLAAIVFAVPPTAIAGQSLAMFALAAVVHGNIRLPERLERALRSVLITVDLHRVHHSVADAEANANFGAVLSLWDRLFGTYLALPRERLEQLAFGVHELPPREMLMPSAMLLVPWRISRAGG